MAVRDRAAGRDGRVPDGQARVARRGSGAGGAGLRRREGRGHIRPPVRAWIRGHADGLQVAGPIVAIGLLFFVGVSWGALIVSAPCWCCTSCGSGRSLRPRSRPSRRLPSPSTRRSLTRVPCRGRASDLDQDVVDDLDHFLQVVPFRRYPLDMRSMRARCSASGWFSCNHRSRSGRMHRRPRQGRDADQHHADALRGRRVHPLRLRHAVDPSELSSRHPRGQVLGTHAFTPC